MQLLATLTYDNDDRRKHTCRNKNKNPEAQSQECSSNCARNEKDSHLSPPGESIHFTIIDRPFAPHPPSISLIHNFGQKKLD